MRWRLRLSEYTFDMHYKPGASHHAPDFLSRTDNDAAVEDINDAILCLALAETANGFLTGSYTGTDMPAPVEYDDIVEAQQTDAFCVELAKRVARKTAKAFFQNKSHGLYRRAPYGDQLVIPESLRERIITLEHHATVSAHPGMNRMYYALRRRYYWPSMVTNIYHTATKCTTCAQTRLSLRRHTFPLMLFPATEPLTDRSVDIFGPTPATKAGNRFILVITDRFSKQTKCVALRRITAISVALAIIDAWVACYGPPDRILSDQGPQLISNFLIAVMKVLGTETVRTTAYHPQTNGHVERYNRTMATQLRLYVTDDPRRWDEILPVLTMAYQSQPHRSTGIAPFELVIPRRIPSLSVRNLPPGTLMKNKGTLKDGSPLARKREFMAKLRQQIPAVVEALQKTQQRCQRNFDSNVDTRNKRVRVGDYVFMMNHQQKNKLQSRTVGPFVVLDADDSTYVIEVNGKERRVNSDHATPAPPTSTPDETPHLLLDGLDKHESTPPVPGEYVIDRLLKLRRSNGIYSAKVRWFDNGPKDDSWEPLENLHRNLVRRFLRRRKKKIAGYSWSIPTPPSRGTRRSPGLNQAETALVVTPQCPEPKRSPTILGVFSNSHGEIRITLNWIKINQSNSVQETLPTCRVRLTLPERTRNIPHDPWLALWRFAELSEWHGPYTYVWLCPPSLQGSDAPPAPVTQGVGSEPNGLLLPSVHDLTTTVEDLMYQSTEATLIVPIWNRAPWYIDAKAACVSHDVLPPASNDHNGETIWALVAFHFNRKTNSATQAKPSLSK